MVAIACKFSKLASHGLSFDAQVNPHQFDALARLATENPDTQIILNHMGCMTREDVQSDATWTGLSKLASCSNLTVKLSVRFG